MPLHPPRVHLSNSVPNRMISLFQVTLVSKICFSIMLSSMMKRILAFSNHLKSNFSQCCQHQPGFRIRSFRIFRRSDRSEKDNPSLKHSDDCRMGLDRIFRWKLSPLDGRKADPRICIFGLSLSGLLG